MTKRDCENRLNVILSNSGTVVEGGVMAGNYFREINMRDWSNYGKDRTYFSIVETCEGTKHYVKRDYGYFDNINGEYVPGKADLTQNFNFGGNKF